MDDRDARHTARGGSAREAAQARKTVAPICTGRHRNRKDHPLLGRNNEGAPDRRQRRHACVTTSLLSLLPSPRILRTSQCQNLTLSSAVEETRFFSNSLIFLDKQRMHVVRHASHLSPSLLSPLSSLSFPFSAKAKTNTTPSDSIECDASWRALRTCLSFQCVRSSKKT